MNVKKAILLLALNLWGCSAQTKIIQGELGGLTFLDGQHGWAVGRGESKKVFVATTQNGGKGWETMQIPCYDIGASLNGVAFRDANQGWTVGSHGLAFATQDGGKNWQKIDAAGDANGLEFGHGLGCIVLGAPGYAHRHGFLAGSSDEFPKGRLTSGSRRGRNFFPWGVKILDSDTLVGYGPSELYLSSDAGGSWQVVELDNAKKTVRDIAFTSEKQGWIACGDGSLLFTKDGGATCETLSTVGLGGRVVERIHFFDENQGVALAHLKDSDWKVLGSADGGKNWKEKLDLGEGDWNQLEVLDRNHAWVGGQVKGSVYIRAFSP